MLAGVLCLLPALLTGFNGLYGQDAHEYLRQSRAFFGVLQGRPYTANTPGDAAFAAGYPLAGALLHLLIPDAVRALQIVSALSAAAALWAFDACLRVLSHGAHRWSRQLYAVLALGGAACFGRAGLTVMSDALGLALSLGAFWFGLRAVEHRQGRYAVGAGVLAGLAVLTRFSLAALMLPLAAGMAWSFRGRPREWGWLGLGVLAGGAGLLPHYWLKASQPALPLGHSLLRDWTPLNLLRHEFSNVNGTVDYGWPNGLYILFPLAHPYFMVLLPGLFWLVWRTDFLRPAKRVLLASLAVYLFFLGGVPHQNLRYLLPAYALLLLLLFPAWDRFVSYGLYFYKKLTWALIGLAAVSQLFFSVKMMQPVWQRNRLERQMAAEIGEIWRQKGGENSGTALYAFDLDVALRSYLPQLPLHNLWVRRYDDFPPGSLLLFNEMRLREQWAGKNPMLNWEFARSRFDLREVAALPEGWTLYEIVKRR